jgi:pyruvate decarboxylase
VVKEELNLQEWPPKPLDLTPPPNPPRTQQACLKALLTEIRQAKRPILLVDACAIRHGLEKQVQQLMEVSGFPMYVAPMGKGAVSENHPQFRGCYAGNVSHPQVQEEVHNSDLVLSIGSLNSDFNTGGFTYHIDQDKIIDLHSFAASIYHANYQKVGKYRSKR